MYICYDPGLKSNEIGTYIPLLVDVIIAATVVVLGNSRGAYILVQSH